MSAPQPVLNLADSVIPLARRLFALLAPARVEPGAEPEAHWLAAQRAASDSHTLAQTLADWRKRPSPEDVHLHRLAKLLRLSDAETIALALALAADVDLVAGRALAWLQAPLRDAHPSVGLIACLVEQSGVPVAATIARLLDGSALASGLFMLEVKGRPLPDALLRLPPALVSALSGGRGHWAGVRLDDGSLPALAPSLQEEARSRAARLGRGALVVRSGHPAEARAACAAIAAARGRCAVFIEGEPPAGLGPWLLLHEAQPVLCGELSPGERRRLPPLPGYGDTVLVACGPEGVWEDDGETLAAWHIAPPPAAERSLLWREQGFDEASAEALGATFRHSGARIAKLARGARALSPHPELAHVARASRETGQGALGSLAELLPEEIDDHALILPDPLWRELRALAARCRVRDTLAQELGPAARARYRPGVKALLVGVSGSGKTLACGWLASHLGMPLYRVDLGAVTSKYIGETEKNLGEIFARGEHAEAILLFDEADALFGKRTDVKDANDRYANQQTNYLLQRIESFDGIVLATSNSRARFDSAFTRRLDAIIEFGAPGPEERRGLWLAHLGGAHALTQSDINRLAATCDLSGGHIRNITLAAKAIAGPEPIGLPALLAALGSEYRKLGKQVPAGLAGRPD
ncbi:AAA family ATPase [Methylococcus sp. EFPC2]|uniref:AAA family ATPase n=1 Tax=Methylococcus sp. EFPC2 TaxID=2812648 RepID=UPI001967DEF7|nr:AAA family ATPase [Methylococcus sp. EFPC2]QSA98408.1 ATP-binding protein [Methylococcus sp. EFPC2]